MKKDGCFIMIRTKDHRKFFTHEENLCQISEFSKVFDAEVSKVIVKEAEVLDLEELAPAVCNASFKSNEPLECEVIEVKMPHKIKKRQEILSNAQKIDKYIEDQFIAKQPVSLNRISKTFQQNNLTKACLCIHLTQIRNKLLTKGFKINKVGRGEYQLA